MDLIVSYTMICGKCPKRITSEDQESARFRMIVHEEIPIEVPEFKVGEQFLEVSENNGGPCDTWKPGFTVEAFELDEKHRLWYKVYAGKPGKHCALVAGNCVRRANYTYGVKKV